MFERNEEGVYIPLKNVVMAFLWLPVLVVVNVGAASLGRYLWRLAGNASTDISGVPIQSQTALLIIAAILGGFIFLYYMLTGETFGWRDTRQATQTAEETAEDVLSDD